MIVLFRKKTNDLDHKRNEKKWNKVLKNEFFFTEETIFLTNFWNKRIDFTELTILLNERFYLKIIYWKKNEKVEKWTMFLRKKTIPFLVERLKKPNKMK